MSDAAAVGAERGEFDRQLAELRPKLHRYCARMTGSVIDGEDVVQEALVKAMEAFADAGPIRNPEAWLFRIAHNAALDFLRSWERSTGYLSERELDMIVDSSDVIGDREAAAASLRLFMRLPAAQRSSVILMDVLGYSLDEIEHITAMTVPSIKAALHRGRVRLRELAGEPDEKPLPRLSIRERALLAAYVERFNARDIDGVRELLSEDVRLHMVTRFQRVGRTDVGGYVGRYADLADWRLVPGLVEGRPAALVVDPTSVSAGPGYFVRLDFRADRVSNIVDFRFARYVMDGAEIVTL